MLSACQNPVQDARPCGKRSRTSKPKSSNSRVCSNSTNARPNAKQRRSPSSRPSRIPKLLDARAVAVMVGMDIVQRRLRSRSTRRWRRPCPTPVPNAAAKFRKPTSINNIRPRFPANRSCGNSTSTAALVRAAANRCRAGIRCRLPMPSALLPANWVPTRRPPSSISTSMLACRTAKSCTLSKRSSASNSVAAPRLRSCCGPGNACSLPTGKFKTASRVPASLPRMKPVGGSEDTPSGFTPGSVMTASPVITSTRNAVPTPYNAFWASTGPAPSSTMVGRPTTSFGVGNFLRDRRHVRIVSQGPEMRLRPIHQQCLVRGHLPLARPNALKRCGQHGKGPENGARLQTRQDGNAPSLPRALPSWPASGASWLPARRGCRRLR